MKFPNIYVPYKIDALSLPIETTSMKVDVDYMLEVQNKISTSTFEIFMGTFQMTQKQNVSLEIDAIREKLFGK